MDRFNHKGLALTAAAAMILAAGAAGQPDTTSRDARRTQPANKTQQPGADKNVDHKMHKPQPLMKLSDVLDIDVTNAQGEDLGEIEDVVIDIGRGRIGYAVLSFGGVMGIGDKLFAVPWESLTPAPGTAKMYVNIDKSRLEAMEGFDKDNYPDMADPAWATRTYQQFEREPYWTTDPWRADRRTAAASRWRGWGTEDRYNKLYDRNHLTDVNGTVVKVDRNRPFDDMDEGVLVTVRTDDGRTQIVHLGPAGYLQNERLTVRENDRIKVHGSSATLNNDKVIIASSVQRDNDTMTFRDDTGWPAWIDRDDRDGVSVADHDDDDKDVKLARFQLARASEVIGADVEGTPDDEDLGEIEDIIVQPSNGRIVYGVLAAGGFLGMGEDKIAIPISALQHRMDGDDHEFFVNMSEDRLKDAPKFGKDSWPNMSDRAWGEPVHSYFGVEPYWVLDERGAGVDSNRERQIRKEREAGRDDRHDDTDHHDRDRK